MSKKEISNERKIAYYGGMALTVIGVLTFLSTFLIVLNPDCFFENPSMGGFMTRPIIGFILIGLGGFLAKVGARGAAGSGLILDPKKAREDLSPWSSMAGGMVNDVLKETTIGSAGAKEIIKVKCRGCSELNDEDAKFCKNCGQTI